MTCKFAQHSNDQLLKLFMPVLRYALPSKSSNQHRILKIKTADSISRHNYEIDNAEQSNNLNVIGRCEDVVQL